MSFSGSLPRLGTRRTPHPVRAGTHPHRAFLRLGSLPSVPALLLGGGFPGDTVDAAGRASRWGGVSGSTVPSDLRREFLGISTITIVVTTATLLVVRWLGVRFTRQDDSGQSARPEPEGLRFSIRGLMIFTAAVALICAGARALEGSRKSFPVHTRLGAVFRCRGAGFPLGGARGRPPPAARSGGVRPLAYARGLLRLRRKCPPGWVDLHPPDHAAVPSGFTGVSARRAVVRLPPRPVGGALHKSTGRRGRSEMVDGELTSTLDDFV